ncbi:hypothetical protein ACP70R_033656 [Stipagrostis hirtigluma subsp. patula]
MGQGRASSEERSAHGDGGGERPPAGREKPAAAETGRVALRRLFAFAFADRTDAALMAVGAVAAVANGMAQPLMTFIFGHVIDAFGSAASPHILHTVTK